MYTPTIHLNGTSRQALLQQARAATKALDEAIDALRVMSPNGRDFYPQGDDAIRDAIREHAARQKVLADMHAELQAYTTRVAQAPGPR